jgi:hypothetical protein
VLLNLIYPNTRPISEIRHEALNGIVDEDTVRSQLLYELQGNIYLNSDVKADLADVKVREIGTNR